MFMSVFVNKTAVARVTIMLLLCKVYSTIFIFFIYPINKLKKTALLSFIFNQTFTKS